MSAKPRFELVQSSETRLKITDHQDNTTVCYFDMINVTLDKRAAMGRVMVAALNAAAEKHAGRQQQQS